MNIIGWQGRTGDVVVTGGLSQGGERPASWCHQPAVGTHSPYGGHLAMLSFWHIMEEFTGANPAVELVDEGKAVWWSQSQSVSSLSLSLVGWWTVLIVCCIAIFLLILIILTTLYVISYRQKQKKKYNFGVKKSKNTVRYWWHHHGSTPDNLHKTKLF